MNAKLVSSFGSRRLSQTKRNRSGLGLILTFVILSAVAFLSEKTSSLRIQDHEVSKLLSSESVQSVEPPVLAEAKAFNSHRTLFLLPGKENRCHYQYDYTCKFWFYIRCYIFGGFPNVKVLSLGPDAVSEFLAQAKDGDIAAVIWRSKNHSIIPENLMSLLERRHASSRNKKMPRVRIGVFHIANEKDRTDWPWYPLPDFIVRNYWIPDMPPHATYVPLGHQLPNTCRPWTTERGKDFLSSTTLQTCSCQGLGFKTASFRRYLWNFSGSLRKRRADLLRRLRHSPSMKDRGFVQVSKKFGGEGVFGSETQNPKTAYLESILESQFVFAPCGNAMETHRIYEAISLGAIPVIENCDPSVSHFFPFRELLIDGGPERMIEFVEKYLNKPSNVDALQKRVQTWWRSYIESLGESVSDTMTRHVPPALRAAP